MMNRQTHWLAGIFRVAAWPVHGRPLFGGGISGSRHAHQPALVEIATQETPLSGFSHGVDRNHSDGHLGDGSVGTDGVRQFPIDIIAG